MFIGIVNNIGAVSNKTRTTLVIKTDKNFLARLEKGMSVAVDGICLTVVAHNKNSFEVNTMPETINKTNIKYLRSGNLVNLELPATANSFLSGHILEGHIDTTGRLRSLTKKNNSRTLKISIPKPFLRYIVAKGSIAVNGISLTVVEVDKDYFSVGIIPYTWKKTMFHVIRAGDMVNVEVDILAKYVEKLFQP